jgi:DNA-binding NarL/FixJ family response regulator
MESTAWDREPWMRSRRGIDVVGEAAHGGEAVRLAQSLRPDVILMDVRMPGMDGSEAACRILAAGGRSRILVLTTFDLDEYADAALRAGASGFLLKDALPEELLAGVRAVAIGCAVVAPAHTRRLLDACAHHLSAPGQDAMPDDPGLRALTERGREVLLAVAKSWTNPGDRRTAGPRGVHRQDARRPGTRQDRCQGPNSSGDLRVRLKPTRPGHQ